MLRFFTLYLFVMSVTACGHKGKICSPSDGIHGIFFMFDGSGTAADAKNWTDINVIKSVELFKTRVSHLMPIWFIQWSSPSSYCDKWHGKNISWECYGVRDPCQIGFQEAQGGNCPTAQEELLPLKWNNASFTAAAQRIFAKPQGGWTRPWGYLKNASETWIAYKETMGLPEEARALVIFYSDGEAQDSKIADEATKKFKEARLKFYGIIQNTRFQQYNFMKYFPLMDNPLKPDLMEATKMDEKIVNKIIDEGCKL